MGITTALLWGLAGGLSFEMLEFYGRCRSASSPDWDKLLPQGRNIFLLALVVRGFLSVVVVAAAASEGRPPGGLTALGLGAAAPLVLQKLARMVKLTDSPPEPSGPPDPEGESSGAV
jgi:hypothetical protein